ncbi:hypothetical protein SBA4_4950011 [Candidatus Sulfopaludibacter sp. SbA4]|nr:hypothetical protein SBA4_4950011 [Candidatus Sulfopaludibacter sp. SbA4]
MHSAQTDERVNIACQCLLAILERAICRTSTSYEIVQLNTFRLKEQLEDFDLTLSDNPFPWRRQAVKQIIHCVSEYSDLDVSLYLLKEAPALGCQTLQRKVDKCGQIMVFRSNVSEHG